jgi:hypothetical protein
MNRGVLQVIIGTSGSPGSCSSPPRPSTTTYGPCWPSSAPSREAAATHAARLGLAGRPGPLRQLGGPVSRYRLAHACCPVLAIPPPRAGPAPPPAHGHRPGHLNLDPHHKWDPSERRPSLL